LMEMSYPYTIQPINCITWLPPVQTNESTLRCTVAQTLSSDFSSRAGVLLVHSDDYENKLKVCPLFLVLMDIYVKAINTSVTHLQMLLTEQSCIIWIIVTYTEDTFSLS
jgi:hypothetical protein